MSPKKSLLIAALGLAIALAVLIVTRSSFGVRAQDVPRFTPIRDGVSNSMRQSLSDAKEATTMNSACPAFDPQPRFTGLHKPAKTAVEMARQADIVAVATLISRGPVYDFYPRYGIASTYQAPHTDLNFKVEAIYKGDIPSEFVMPFNDGKLPAVGKLPAADLDLPHPFKFEDGARYMLFLNRGFLDNPAMDNPKSKDVIRPTAYGSWFRLVGDAACPATADSIDAYRAMFVALPQTVSDLKDAINGIEISIRPTAFVPSTPGDGNVNATPTIPVTIPVAGDTPVPPPIKPEP